MLKRKAINKEEKFFRKRVVGSLAISMPILLNSFKMTSTSNLFFITNDNIVWFIEYLNLKKDLFDCQLYFHFGKSRNKV